METQMLVSVVSVDEAYSIYDIADVVDVKSSRGPFGPPEVDEVAAIRKAIGSSVPLSVALGEIRARSADVAPLAAEMAAAGADIVKLAVFDTTPADTLSTLSAVREAVPPGVRLVLAAFVDGPQWRPVTPFDIPFVASASGASGILLDTRRKGSGSLLDYMKTGEIRSIVDEARGLGLTTALAGSLGFDHLRRVLGIGPDYVGFRSAITKAGVHASVGVDREKVRQLKNALNSLNAQRKKGLA